MRLKMRLKSIVFSLNELQGTANAPNQVCPFRPTGCPENHDADGFCLSLPIVIQKNDEAFEATSKSVVQILTTNDVTLAYNEVQVIGTYNRFTKIYLTLSFNHRRWLIKELWF